MKSFAFVLALPFFLACSSSSSSSSAPSADAGPATEDADVAHDAAAAPDLDAGVEASAPADASEGTTYLRLANLSPDAPAMDLCVAKGGNITFVGPMLATPAGVGYAQATHYLPLAPDSYDVRLVAAGATDCTTSVGSFSMSLSTLRDGQYTTIAAEGELHVVGNDTPFGVYAYTDDATAPAGEVALRFINASSSLGMVDFGAGTLAASTFAPLFVDTQFGHAAMALAGDAGTLDGDSYVGRSAPSAITMSAHATGGASDAVTASSVTAAAGSVVTMFLIGGKTGDAAHPTALLLCDDNAAPAGALASCSVVSP